MQSFGSRGYDMTASGRHREGRQKPQDRRQLSTEALADWPVARDVLGYSAKEYLSLVSDAGSPDEIREEQAQLRADALLAGQPEPPAPLPAASGPAPDPEPGRMGKAQARQAARHGRQSDGASSGTPEQSLTAFTRQMYDWLDFDPHGRGEWAAALAHPLEAVQSLWLSGKAKAMQERLVEAGVLPPEERGRNLSADAFRHAYWSFLAQQALGDPGMTDRAGHRRQWHPAKLFGDAHEISSTNDPPERLMDLKNNLIGRELASDPRNAGRDPVEVILEAWRLGKLQIMPYPEASAWGTGAI